MLFVFYNTEILTSTFRKDGSGLYSPSLRWSSTHCCRMRTVLLFVFLWCTSDLICALKKQHRVHGNIRGFAVSNRTVFVVTDCQLLQMDLHLKVENQKHLCKDTHPNQVNILLPFEKNETLITCGTAGGGYCEVLDITDITRSIYREEVEVGASVNSSSAAFLVDFNDEGKEETYMSVAREKNSAAEVTLRNTLHSQFGEIFSEASKKSAAYIKATGAVEWVGGFQTSPSHSYLLVNIRSETDPAVVVLRMNNSKIKADMTKSLHGATLQCCDDKARRKLLSSSVISSSGSPLLWAGIFTSQEAHNPEKTALAIYNFTQLTNQVPSGFQCFPPCSSKEGNQVLNPLAVVFKHISMTSVAAEKNRSWIVLYIGTASGQLMKIVLDKDFNSGCAIVLYQSDDDSMVFPSMFISDHNYIYVALGNQILQVEVNQCHVYNTLGECVASQDSACGWCVKSNKCCAQDQCSTSAWISIGEHFFQKELISFQVNQVSNEVTLSLNLHLSLFGAKTLPLKCAFTVDDGNLCGNITANFPNCNCTFSSKKIPANVTAKVTIKDQSITDKLKLRNCTGIGETSLYARCLSCLSSGCYWSSDKCLWTTKSEQQGRQDSVCKGLPSEENTVVIYNVTPSEVSFYGKNNVVLRGENLGQVKKIHLIRRFQGATCPSVEIPVFERTNDALKFNLPRGNKGSRKLCVVTEDGHYHCNATITYSSVPTCTRLQPRNTWQSGMRKIKVLGNNLNFVDAVVHAPTNDINHNLTRIINPNEILFHTLEMKEQKTHNVSLIMGNSTVTCGDKLTYLPNPKFTSFTTSQMGNVLLVTIQKTEDSLNMSKEDVIVLGLKEEEDTSPHECNIEQITATALTCRISGKNKHTISVDSLKIVVGSFVEVLETSQSNNYLYALTALVILILLGAPVGVFIHRKSKQQMNAQMNERLELLESEIRNEIRQGFVDLQTEKSDLIENVGAIPFLDYKHFALKIFFPEGGPLASLMIKDIGQDAGKIEADQKCQAFSRLIRDQMFLTCFIHGLEEQKNFSIKDKCVVASLLTVALHDDLPYLTQLMEDLLQSLMDQPSNAQPKLLLRRTESIVEKLLTNWMSICLYGFLRESVGQSLFLLVSALTQQISKGPVDSVTEKALYTLSEDWLLWQAQGFNFSPLKLKVLFAVGTEGEVSDSLEVNALTCDTIEQVKEKILQTFQRKFGFPYTQQLREIDIEYEKEGSYVPLEEVDNSSEVLGEVTMLNTLKHYQIPDGASIKVMTKKVHAPLSPQTSLKDDQNFSAKYFHLIDPDIDRDESNHPERKKLKLKEIYLTKLLSTKVAVHSFVENLFRNIWGMPNNKAPSAVKYFFDFLDVQAEKKKITDPDVLHIWKTNSLPLRFWVNILKNPNFVFSDLEKTSHLDACLSVIAQAFMDSFSLTDQQLGKHAPTNKLLYAKDIPQYKQEVKTYYKMVRDQTSASSQEFKSFLQHESKKHDNEFNESAALRELYKYMNRYFSEIIQKLEQKDASPTLMEEMHRVKDLFEDMKRSAWS